MAARDANEFTSQPSIALKQIVAPSSCASLGTRSAGVLVSTSGTERWMGYVELPSR